MQFKKCFHGYEPSQVDEFLKQQSEQNAQLQASQRERIAELLEDNARLSELVKQYQAEEKAISKSLVESQKLAEELRNDADRYSELVLSRAKIFYATWHAYSATLVATLSAEEVAQFEKLQEKIGKLIADYQGEVFVGRVDIPQTDTQTTATVGKTENLCDTETAENIRESDVMPSEKTMSVLVNPIEKVASASGQVIDLKELVKTDESLEDLCAELGIVGKKD